MKVLLVDDSKAARFAMRNLLQKQGLEVVMAETGEEALEKLEAELVDVVFMDQSMPGMGGIKATQEITGNDRTSHIPVVLCTGNEGDKLEEMAEEAGAVGVLTKPPKADKLKAILAGIRPAAPVAEEAEEAAEQPEAVAGAAVDIGPLADAIETLRQQLEQIEAGIDERINKAVSDAAAAAEASSKPLHDKMEKAVSTLGQQIAQQVKDQIASDASNTRIQLEALRQQVESALDDMSEKEDGMRKDISNHALMQAGQLLNSRLGDLKDTVTKTESELREDVERLKSQVSGMEKGLVTKAAIMAAVAAVVAIGVGLLF